MGIICPGGQEVGDRTSGDQMGSGPNASQPKIEAGLESGIRLCLKFMEYKKYNFQYKR